MRRDSKTLVKTLSVLVLEEWISWQFQIQETEQAITIYKVNTICNRQSNQLILTDTGRI